MSEWPWSPWQGYSAWDWKPTQPPQRGPYSLVMITAPTAPPIDFATAAAHLRLGDPASPEAVAQQQLVETMIAAAAGEIQRYCNLAIMTQQWRLVSDAISSPYTLPKSPLRSVDSVAAADGTTVDPSTYTVVLDERLPGVVTGLPTSAKIEFTAGWPSAADIPAELVQAMLLMIGTWFMHRESVQAFSLFEIPGVAGVQQLLDSFRVEVFA
jgi:uncharacterized phiE125 gp8 family phage protein